MNVKEAVKLFEELEGELAGSDLSDEDYLEVLDEIIDKTRTARDAKREEME